MVFSVVSMMMFVAGTAAVVAAAAADGDTYLNSLSKDHHNFAADRSVDYYLNQNNFCYLVARKKFSPRARVQYRRPILRHFLTLGICLNKN